MNNTIPTGEGAINQTGVEGMIKSVQSFEVPIKRMSWMAMVLILFCVGCKGQEKEKAEPTKKSVQELKEEPKGQWEVHKEYDDLGNLIRYDSIYSYSYSSVAGDSLKVNLDSIMDSFKRYFDEHSLFDWQEDFSFAPSADSLFMKDFFEEDYFFRNWERHHPKIDEMVKKMDSIRNEFLKKYHPGLLSSKPEE